jgi:hypothetical protein
MKTHRPSCNGGLHLPHPGVHRSDFKLHFVRPLNLEMRGHCSSDGGQRRPGIGTTHLRLQVTVATAQRLPPPTLSILPVVQSAYATRPMSGINFNSWTENATRLGMRIQETLAEHTKDLSLTSSGAGYYDTGEEMTKNIKAHLESGGEREKLEAMKRLIAVSVSPHP